MIVYLMIIMLILISGMTFLINPMHSESIAAKNSYLLLIGILLVLIAGFRGDFTSDYSGYEQIFEFYNRSFEQSIHFRNSLSVETGFVLMNWLVGIFSDNAIWIFLFSAIVTIFLYFREIRKYSTNIFLSVLLFVTIGEYYTSFNIMRQIMTAAIIFAGSTFLYEKKMKKYFMVVIFASFFHTTALIMIPFYFILNINFNYRKLLTILFFLLVLSINIGPALAFFQQYVYSHYESSSYGMSGYGFKNILVPFAIFCFTIFGYSMILDEKDDKLNVWFNAITFYVFFMFLGLNIEMLERFSYFFLPYVLLMLPKIITSEKDIHFRLMYYVVIISISISFNLITLSGTGYDPFYFIWNR